MMVNERRERLGMTPDKGSQPDTKHGRCSSWPALTPNPPGHPMRQQRGKSIYKTNNRWGCEIKLNLTEATTQEGVGRGDLSLTECWSCLYAHVHTGTPGPGVSHTADDDATGNKEQKAAGMTSRAEMLSLFDWQVISEKWRKNKNYQKCHYKSSLALKQTINLVNPVLHRSID